ncbi:cytochrome b5 reductase 4 isoform 2-T2 [Glossina fuscipes fuscipes]
MTENLFLLPLLWGNICITMNTKSSDSNAFINSSLQTSADGIKSQKSASSGSATGNLRNKCALKPGHSLMDWIRLGNSGEDLSGTQGRLTTVSMEELSKHNSRNDAWIAIRGVVYNITRYMDFHPGGVDELMRGVGKDSTQLFSEVHAWVNYQQLLNKCCIGPLKKIVKVQPDLIKHLEAKISLKEGELLQLPKAKFEVEPRFDWIQKLNDLTIYVYTKQFCNPGFLIKKMNGVNHVEIWILTEAGIHKFQYELHGGVEWPPKDLKMSTESGKLEINFCKSEQHRELWRSLGTHNIKKLMKSSCEEEIFIDFQVIKNQQFNHDSHELVLQNKHAILIVPVGYHVTLGLNWEALKKDYTPVPAKYLSCMEKREFSTLNLLIKKYTPRQCFSSRLSEQMEDTCLQISMPKGNLKLLSLAKHRNLCLLAAGSGLTPFLGMIEHLLKRQTNRIELLYLFYFNKTSEDIWCQKILEESSKEDERFKFVSMLSRDSDGWDGLKGQISENLLLPLVDKSCRNPITYIAVCGPIGFNAKAEEIVKSIGFSTENFYVFQG